MTYLESFNFPDKYAKKILDFPFYQLTMIYGTLLEFFPTIKLNL